MKSKNNENIPSENVLWAGLQNLMGCWDLENKESETRFKHHCQWPLFRCRNFWIIFSGFQNVLPPKLHDETFHCRAVEVLWGCGLMLKNADTTNHVDHRCEGETWIFIAQTVLQTVCGWCEKRPVRSVARLVYKSEVTKKDPHMKL